MTSVDAPTPPRRPLPRAIDGLAGALGLVSAGCVVLLLLAVVTDVVWTNAGGRGILGLVEYGEIAVVLIVFLSLAQAQRTDSHVAVDVLVERFSARAAGMLRTVVLISMGLLLIWMAYETLQTAMQSFAVREARFGLVHVPIWPARFAIPLGFFAMALQCLTQGSDEIQVLRGRRSQTHDSLNVEGLL